MFVQNKPQMQAQTEQRIRKRTTQHRQVTGRESGAGEGHEKGRSNGKRASEGDAGVHVCREKESERHHKKKTENADKIRLK